MYCNQELLSVLDLYLLTIRNRSQFAFHGSVAACLNVLFKHCFWVERTLSNSRLQTYRILHDNLSKIWNTFFVSLTLEKASWVKMPKSEEIPQPEAKIRQASWVKNTKSEEMPQLEAERKQADWVKMSKREEMPQPEAERRQADWVKNTKSEEMPQLEGKRKQVDWEKMPKREEMLQLERKRKLTRPQGRCYTDNCDVNM